MTKAENGSVESTGGGQDRRQRERRGSDRRQDDRRSRPPIRRRPAAYVTYGVVGTSIVLSFLWTLGGRSDEPTAAPTFLANVEAESDIEGSPRTEPSREAFGLNEFEKLLAEGESALGTVVKAELYCEIVLPTQVRSTPNVSPSLRRLVDGQGRVGGAECRWSTESRSSDFFLVVPPELAEQFAASPEVELNFVRRRRIVATLEWLGRSDALALRTAGILRTLEPAAEVPR